MQPRQTQEVVVAGGERAERETHSQQTNHDAHRDQGAEYAAVSPEYTAEG